MEARILDLVAGLFPEVFASLDRFYERHRDFLDPTIVRFDREAQFYVGYLDHLHGLESAGLAFCYPRVSDTSKAMSASETFDLALAHRLVGERTRVVVRRPADGLAYAAAIAEKCGLTYERLTNRLAS